MFIFPAAYLLFEFLAHGDQLAPTLLRPDSDEPRRPEDASSANCL